jgi:phosphotransferase system enzyme I (PtsI)
VTLALTGLGVSRGIAIGRCHLVVSNELEIGEHRISPDEVDREIERYRAALGAARRQLEELVDSIHAGVTVAATDIIQTHILMLDDSTFRDGTERRIAKELCNAEWALQSQLEEVLTEFRGMNDEYIRTRGEDVKQVVRLVQSRLNEEIGTQPFEELPDRLAETLVIASELTPGELAILHQRGVAGIVTEHGGPHSHTAIMASSLGIPAVLGVRRAQELLREGETLILDGGQGLVYASPDTTIRGHYEQVQADTRRFRLALEAIRDEPCVSRDGSRIHLLANAERVPDIRQAIADGAEGIGLYRTEFLYLQGKPPGEEEQLAEFLAALEALDGRPLTIRTLDIGADKLIDPLDAAPPPRGANPALGLRAIRLCLRDVDGFRRQLRGILRASAHGPVRCLIPMLTNVSEILAVRHLLGEARRELDEAGIAYDRDMPVGGMIEVPAAALALADIGPHLDFISVGTNDLLQYTLAADRIDEQVAHLYDMQHSGVLRLLRHIFREADALGIPAAVCGEVAGDRRYTRLLLALGLREFSMYPGRLLEIKQVIRQTDIPRAQAALTRWLHEPGSRSGRKLVEAIDESQH